MPLVEVAIMGKHYTPSSTAQTPVVRKTAPLRAEDLCNSGSTLAPSVSCP